MSHFDIDEYAELRSPVHDFDPRAKLICIFILMISIVLLSDLLILVIGLFIAIGLVLLSKLPFLFILRRLKWVALFMFAVLVLLPLTVGHTSILSFYFINIYEEGLFLAITIALKAFTVVLLIFPALSTMKFVTFIKALEKLRLPNKLVQIITFTYRYIFVLSNELKRTLTSIETRSYSRRSMGFRLRVLSNAIGMLLVRSYERGERIFQAMLARGYSGSLKTLEKFRMRSVDWAKGCAIIFIAIILHIFAYYNLLHLGYLGVS
jgi:cobalt/nickel transport system permease protein